MKILIINGPNLDLVGEREPEIYGDQTFDDLLPALKEEFPTIDFEIYQSGVEADLIDQLHRAKADTILFNPGGLTHTSVAIADAVAAIQVPVMEVHISYPGKREDFRHRSLITEHCIGTIEGLGMDSYRLAVSHVATETA
jgi:3-dehydroquinate dehydratase-2